ncbi:hypothetical protein ABMA32_03500 [Mesorhizobium sp. VNQ89]|uniref:hypothetical protein n=1 Tax=Mesorhizobium quangtriensis TaxID=3157709 RepID=UPI0032B7455A
MDRAGRYVLGLMDEDERERAERDLEVDPAFREAMVLIAERMHVFDKAKPTASEALADNHDPWRLIKDRIDAMPQMRPIDGKLLPPPPNVAVDAVPRGGAVPAASTGQKPDSADKTATFGRRKTDVFKVPVTVQEPEVKRMWLDASRSAIAIKLAMALVIAFALGYVAGRM